MLAGHFHTPGFPAALYFAPGLNEIRTFVVMIELHFGQVEVKLVGMCS